MKKIVSVFLLFLALYTLEGCKTFVEGINDDPNNPIDAPLPSLINGLFTGLIVANEGHDARLAGIWSRHFSGVDRQYSALDVYNTNSEDFTWEKFYLVVKNSDICVEKATAERNNLALGIAKILKAHALGNIVALYGDIPMTEAGRFPEVANPRFDPQMEVYSGIQKLLDEAIGHLGQPMANIGEIAAIDFYFAGDPAAWARVANALKTRYFLHVGKYAEALATAPKGIYKTNQNWVIPHTSGAQDQDMNIYFNFGNIQRQGYMDASSAYLPALLDKTSAVYRGNIKTSESARFEYFYQGTTGRYDLNYAATGAYAANAPFPLITALETHLIEAESYARTNETVKALEHLNVARSILKTTFPAGKYDPYEWSDFGAGGIVGRAGESAATALLYEIIEEKYCSLTGQTEVFNDLRRTDNLIGIKPTKGTQLPERYLIPQGEIDANNSVPNPLPSLFDPTTANK